MINAIFPANVDTKFRHLEHLDGVFINPVIHRRFDCGEPGPLTLEDLPGRCIEEAVGRLDHPGWKALHCTIEVHRETRIQKREPLSSLLSDGHGRMDSLLDSPLAINNLDLIVWISIGQFNETWPVEFNSS